MNARELYQAGKLDEAIQALIADLKNDPGNDKQRVFLFELLSFAGAWDRAEKQLDVLAHAGGNVGLGTLVYRGAIAAERTRQQTFEAGGLPGTDAAETVAGSCNGTRFEWISDADPRIGPRLEVFAAGQYMWVPFEQIESIAIPAPRRLRDLLWTPAIVHTGPSFGDKDLGDVLLPAVCALSARHADNAVRLGRMTIWEESPDGAIPFGQKVLIVDDEEVPLLEIRELTIGAAAAVEGSAAG